MSVLEKTKTPPFQQQIKQSESSSFEIMGKPSVLFKFAHDINCCCIDTPWAPVVIRRWTRRFNSMCGPRVARGRRRALFRTLRWTRNRAQKDKSGAPWGARRRRTSTRPLWRVGGRGKAYARGGEAETGAGAGKASAFAGGRFAFDLFVGKVLRAIP